MSHHERTVDAARGKWRGILLELGVPASALTGKHTSCPLCGGKDRFMFDDKEGKGGSICHQCGARSGIGLAMGFTGSTFQEVAKRIDALLGNLKPDPTRPKREISDEDRTALLREMFRGSRPVESGDLVDRYLTSRGLGEVEYPAALRFHSGLRDGEGGIRPAMLAMVGIPGGPKFATIHRTFLRSDGAGKAEMASPRKIMPGSIPEGACVPLSDYQGGPLGIAEGIETALAASALFEMPVWSAINSTMLEKWSPPAGCDEVVVFGDNDPKLGGQKSAYALGHRLSRSISVTVRIPEEPDTDWADVWVRHVRSRAA